MSSVTTCPEGFLAPPTVIPTSPTPSVTSVSSTGGGGGGSPGLLATSPLLSPGGSNTQSFVHKLFKMVNDATTDHIVRWTSSGESFIIDNASEFEKLLPRYYKHSNISSFIRQANMYGFHKVNKAPRTRDSNVRDYEFANPNFKRGRPDLLDNIRRKQPEKSPSSSSSGSNINDPLKQPSPDSVPGMDTLVDSHSSSASASMFGSIDPSTHFMTQPLESQSFDSVIAVSLASSASNLSLSSSTPASNGTSGGGGFTVDGILPQGMQPTAPIAMQHHLNVGATPLPTMLSMSPPDVSHSSTATTQHHQQQQHQQSSESLQSHLNHMHNRIHTLSEQLSEQRRIARAHEVALIHISSWLRQQGVNIPFSPSAAPGTLDMLTNQQQQQQQQQQLRQHQQAQVAIQLNGQFIHDGSQASHVGYTSPTPTGSSLSPTASMGMDPLSLSRTGSMSPTQLALLAGVSNASPGLTASMAALDMNMSPNMHMLHVSGPGSRRGSMDASAASMMGIDPAMLIQMQQMQQQNQQQQLMMQLQMQAQAQQQMQQADGTTPLSVSSALDPMFPTQLNINGLGHQ